MPETFTPFFALSLAGLVFTVAGIAFILMRPAAPGSAVLAGSLSAGFAAFTAVTIATEGVLPVVINHTSNLWGVQVWWDLLISLSVALFFVLPRARAVGMNAAPWVISILATGSIGLLAMCARLFWLEQAHSAPQTA